SVLEKARAALLLHPKKDRRELSFLAQNRLIFVFQPNIIKNQQTTRYAKWFKFAEKTRNPNNTASDFDEFSNNSIFAQMIHRLAVNHVDNQDLIKEMGEEAYRAAKKLGEEVQKAEERHFMYWDIYDEITGQYKEEFDATLKAERQLRFAAIDRAEEAIVLAAAAKRLLEKAEIENQKEKERMEKEKERMEKKMAMEKQEALKLVEKEKLERLAAKKLLQEEQKKARKLEKEQKKLLEQEKQRAKSLLEQKQILVMHNLFIAGLSNDIIAKSLDVSIEQILIWQKLKK
ncbi:MAG: hypothetical protein RL329_4188, partial [Bacteroidota bacterium]